MKLMKKKWQIANLLFNDNTNFDYSLTYTNEAGDSVTLYDSDTFWDKVVYKYTSWCITSPSFYDTETNTIIYTADNINKAIMMLHKLYNIWRNEKLPGFIKLYEAMRANYNPIWNVDGVTGIISEDTHTGSSTDARSGNDTTTASGTDTTTASGTDSTLHSGTITNGKNVTLDQNIRSGSVTTAASGTDTTTNQVSTFDDVTNWKNKDKSALGYGKSETETYNNLTDAHTYSDLDTQTNNNTDATTYGKADATVYGRSDRTDYNSSNTETRNLSDKHVEMNIRQGNIGVTKTQELLESQLDLTNRDELIDYMIADFIHNNCII